MQQKTVSLRTVFIPVLVLILLLVLVPVRADASSDTWTQANLTYTISGSTVVITRYKGNAETLTVPAQTLINGHNYSTVISSDSTTASFFANNPKSVTFKSGVRFTQMRSLFLDRTALTTVVFETGIDVSAVTDMSSVFNGCTALTAVDLTALNAGSSNTARVTNMNYMFRNCTALRSVDLTGLDTSAVRDMRQMFVSCSALTTLNVTGFNTANVQDMQGLFYGCSGLTSLDLSGFNTAAVWDMGGMFAGCTKLTSLDLSNFNTASVTVGRSNDTWSGMGAMFYNCTALGTLNLSNFTISSTTITDNFFTGDTTLRNIVLPSFVDSNKVVTLPATSWSLENGMGAISAYNATSLPTGAGGGRLFRVIYVNGFTADDASPQVGETITWTPRVYGGTQPYSYYFQLYKGSAMVDSQPWSATGTFAHTFQDTNAEGAGTYRLFVYVRDANSIEVLSDPYDFNVAGPVNITALAISATNITTGTTVTLTPTVEGAATPFQYAYVLYNCTAKTYSMVQNYSPSATELKYRFPNPGTYQLFAYAKDANGMIANRGTDVITVTGTAQPTVRSVTPDITAGTAGDTVTWTISAAGGTTPYSYYYKLLCKGADGKDVDVAYQSWTTATTYKYTFLNPGEYRLLGYVKDKNGSQHYAYSAYVTISGVAQPVISAVQASATSSTTTGSVTWTPVVSGGTRPYEYWYQLYKDGALYQSSNWVNDINYSYTFSEAGEYQMFVYVRDANLAQVVLGSAKLPVHDKLVISAVTPSAASVAENATVTWTPIVTGGKAPLQYSYTLLKGTAQVAAKTWSDSTSYAYKLTAAGKYTLRTSVKDATGTTVTLDSPEVTVISSIPALGITSVTADLVSGNVGNSVKWTVTPTGGKTPYQYSYYVYQGANVVYTKDWSTASTLTYKFTATGTYKLRVYLRDAQSTKVTKDSASIVVSPPAALSVVSVNANAPSVALNGNITWTSVATGGTAPYQFCFKLYKDAALVTTRDYSTAASYTYKATAAGEYNVIAYVKDATGAIVNKTSSNVTVAAPTPLAITSVTSSATTAAPGSPVTWTVNATGGTAPLYYCFYLYKDNVKIGSTSWAAAKTYTYTPADAGVYKVLGFARDASGSRLSQVSSNVTVGTVTPLAITSVTPNTAATISLGTDITWTVNATGGTGSLQYCYYLYKDGARVGTTSWSASNTYTYTPATAGVYKALGFARDAGNTRITQYSANITVGTVTPLAITSVTPSAATSVTLGNDITWAVNATGGTGSLIYCFYLYKDGARISTTSWAASNTYTYAPTGEGVYKVLGFARDAGNTRIAQYSANVTVEAAEDALAVEALAIDSVEATDNADNLISAPVAVNTEITWKIVVTGGTTPCEFQFELYKDEATDPMETQAYSSAADSDTFTYELTEAGEYKVRVFVKDANGNIIDEYSEIITVTASEVNE